jgi:hypothetical protein
MIRLTAEVYVTSFIQIVDEVLHCPHGKRVHRVGVEQDGSAVALQQKLVWKIRLFG